MRPIICGGRDYLLTGTDYDFLLSLHIALHFEVVITGGSSGADYWAKMWAESKGIQTVELCANWNYHGRAAGPIRNRKMAEIGDCVIAFPGGGGTENMISIGKRLGMEVLKP